MLFPQENTSLSNSSVVILEEGGKPLSGAVSSGEPFQPNSIPAGANIYSKETLDKTAEAHGVQKALVLSKKDMDAALREAAQLGANYFQQLQHIRDNVIQRKNSKPDSEPLVMSGRHFILDLFSSSLKKVLPSKFNVLVFVDQRTSPVQVSVSPYPTGTFAYRAILLSYFQGKLDQFFEPDFSSLHENRIVEWTKQHQAIGQYLESRYMMPCFGIFMYQDVWQKCLETAGSAANSKPWAEFVRRFDDQKAFVYPLKLLPKALIAFQRLIMYFGRA